MHINYEIIDPYKKLQNYLSLNLSLKLEFEFTIRILIRIDTKIL